MNTEKTEMLRLKVCSFSCMLDTKVTNVVYDHFQDSYSYWSLKLGSALGNTRNSLRALILNTFQLFIHETKTRKLLSQQHSSSWSEKVIFKMLLLP